ncbi:lipopolysaccharide biosynthesis protein [Ramlibacter algicola]|uniref:O-antigen/teichoic acid export membrane protein n=1 Tax=Ramlibacter algicola TaxID=2795217 RepID=A0A934PWV6_9BURK|nr:hypothetical protein [Ramlibacter algicola]MBK0391969.1 hypothetical protein [Ramlibacter algicola]
MLKLHLSTTGSPVWAIADQLIVSGGSFCTSLIAAYVLTKNGFATYSLALLSVQFILSFERALLAQPLAVLGATEQPEALLRRYKTVLQLLWLCTPAGCCVLIAASAAFFPDVFVLGATAALLLILGIQEIFRRYLYTVRNFRAATLWSCLTYCLQLALLASLSSSGNARRDSGFEVLIACAIAGALPLVLSLGRRRQNVTAGALRATFVEHWKFAKWVVYSQLVFWTSTQAYPFLLEGYKAEGLADFFVANSLLNVLNVLRTAIGNYLPTRASAVLNDGGPRELAKFMFRNVWIYAATSLLILVVLISSSALLIETLYGGKYAAAAPLLALMSLAHLAYVISAIGNAIGLALRATKWIFIGNSLGAAFSMTIGVALVHKFGVWGAAVGYVLAAALPAIAQGANVVFTLREQVASESVRD